MNKPNKPFSALLKDPLTTIDGKEIRTTVNLPEAQRAALDALAIEQQRSVGQLGGMLIQEALQARGQTACAGCPYKQRASLKRGMMKQLSALLRKAADWLTPPSGLQC